MSAFRELLNDMAGALDDYQRLPMSSNARSDYTAKLDAAAKLAAAADEVVTYLQGSARDSLHEAIDQED